MLTSAVPFSEPLKLYPHDFPELTRSVSTFVDSYGKALNVFRDAVSELFQAREQVLVHGSENTVLVFEKSGDLYKETMNREVGNMDLASGHEEFQRKLDAQDKAAKVITSVFAALAVRIFCLAYERCIDPYYSFPYDKCISSLMVPQTTSVCVDIVAKVSPAAAPVAVWMSGFCEASAASLAGTALALAYVFDGGKQKDEQKKGEFDFGFPACG